MIDCIPLVAPLSRARIENMAKSILAKHYPLALSRPTAIDVVDFCDRVLLEHYGIECFVDHLAWMDGTEGLALPDNTVLIDEQVYCAAVDGDGRSRFTMIHEAFHSIQHSPQIRRAIKDQRGNLRRYRKNQVPAYMDPEWQANTFASAFLMPEQAVRAYLAGRYADSPLALLISLKFRVSEKAARVRLGKLEITNQ
ncbi:MAG: ImmA/IrrE family metallo-endopeptidase [Planctomycetota bacterium]|nr:ImmA/IrrE family metallo-endopeptidase [Planctomycetota bacterium]